MLRFIRLLAFPVIVAGIARAQVVPFDTTWTGAASSDWNTAGNWSPATVPTSTSFVGITAATNNPVTISGAASADIVVVGSGAGSTASLTVQSGGTLTLNTPSNGFIVLGDTVNSSGTLTIGAGATVSGAAAIVGYQGTGNMTVSGGGVMDAAVQLASSDGSAGSLTVTGTGSQVTGGVGSVQGNATLTVTNGGIVDGGLNIGGNGLSTVTVSNGGRINGEIDLGAYGGGTVSGTITGGTHTVGSIRIDGAISSVSTTFTVSGGATLDGSAAGSASGVGSSGLGAMTLTGTGTSWTNASDFIVGGNFTGSTGTFTISDHASMSHASFMIGNVTGATGTVNVTTNATVNVLSGGVTVGNSGTGTLSIASGGVVNSLTGLVSNAAGASGTVTISGAGSAWNVNAAGTGFFEVGAGGPGSVTVSNGGTLTNGLIATIGSRTGSNGSITVTGPGSSWTSANTVTLGAQGTAVGTITVADSATFTISNNHLILGTNTNTSGTLNIGAPANLAPAAPGTVSVAGEIRGIFGNGTVVFNHTSGSYQFGSTIALAAAVLQKAGTTTLTAGNTYSGTTTVTGGTLELGSSNRLPSASAMTLGGGTFATGGFNQTLGALTLSLNSTINFGSGTSALVFADSSAIAWSPGATLSLLSYTNGVDSLRFGSSSAALTPTQLSQITFAGGFAAQIDANGFVTPSAIPEPGTYALLAGLATLGLAAHRRRKSTVATKAAA